MKKILCIAIAFCISGLSSAFGSPLKVVSWNIEHLAESNLKGCRPRTNEDYAALANFAASLNADVVAVQEVENKKALQRVFPTSSWNVEMAAQELGAGSKCSNTNNNTMTQQLTGFAIKKTLNYKRLDDLKLDVTPRLRNSTQIMIAPQGSSPLYLLAVHLKSGCFDKPKTAADNACSSLARQIPLLEKWIDDKATKKESFIVLGDFNRRLNKKNDWVWSEIDDGHPNDFADLTKATGNLKGCFSKYPELIDHIVMDRHLGSGIKSAETISYPSSVLSDHCPISATIELKSGIVNAALSSPDVHVNDMVNTLETTSSLVVSDLKGKELRAYLKTQYFDGKHKDLKYNKARTLMYSEIDVVEGFVYDVYAGFSKKAEAVTYLEPINAEHTIPQSWFDKLDPMKSDLHHLFPTHNVVNSARGSKPFSDIVDTKTQTWYWSKDNQLISASGIPQENIEKYSENTKSFFEPPENHKGNVARAAAYFFTVYPHYEDHLKKLFGANSLETLRKWNEQDPVDIQERTRNKLIEKHQGNLNPFVEDSSLVCKAWGC